MLRLSITIAVLVAFAGCAPKPASEVEYEAQKAHAEDLMDQCLDRKDMKACSAVCEGDATELPIVHAPACPPACASGRIESCRKMCRFDKADGEQACLKALKAGDPQTCLVYIEAKRPLPADFGPDDMEAALDTKCSGGDKWGCYVLGRQRLARTTAAPNGDVAALLDLTKLFKKTCTQSPRVKYRDPQQRSCYEYACLTGDLKTTGFPKLTRDECRAGAAGRLSFAINPADVK